MNTNFLLALCLVGGVFIAVLACYALHIAVQTNIRISAFEKSTHNVQYVPLEQMPGFTQPEDDIEPEDDAQKKIQRAEQASWDALRDMEDSLNQRGTIPLD